MAEQVSGTLITEISAIPAEQGRLIYLCLKAPKSGQVHNFFLDANLGEKFYPLIMRAVGLAKQQRDKAGIPPSVAADGTPLLVASNASAERSGEAVQLALEFELTPPMKIQISQELAAALAAALRPDQPAPAQVAATADSETPKPKAGKPRPPRAAKPARQKRKG